MNFPSSLRPLVRWINLLPLWRLARVRVWGQRLRAPTFDRWLCLVLHRAGMMGKADHAFLLAHLRAGMTVVDIGANQGLYALLFSQRVGVGGRVLAFEPDDMLHAALEENVAHNRAGNVRAYHLALGSASGTMTLYRSLLNSGDNRLAATARAAGLREAVHIQVERLDQVLAGEHVNFIKMDVQGWEMEVFRGMEHLLDDPQNQAMAIYFEYWPQGLRDAGSDPIAPLEFLSAKRFKLFDATNPTTAPIQDVSAFARSVKAGTYINLYALRQSSDLPEL